MPSPALASVCEQPWARDGRELLHPCPSFPGYPLHKRCGCPLTTIVQPTNAGLLPKAQC